MRIAFFSAHGFERDAFNTANAQFNHVLHYLEARLTEETAALASGCDAVCAFVSDRLSAPVLERLHAGGVRLVLLRSAGFDNVDLATAERLGLPVLRVPAYSPYAVAEHAFALLLGLIRKIPQARARVREANFLLDGLVGFDLHGKTFGIVGTGRIGLAAARIARGFGCRVLAYDQVTDEALAREFGFTWAPLDTLWAESDVVSLHVPATTATHHLVDARALGLMKRSAILVNTSRGALVDTAALVTALRQGRIKGAALDVYEGEAAYFFTDKSGAVLPDELLMWLTNMPNVLITAHQGFLTDEALSNIAVATLSNATEFATGAKLTNAVTSGAPRPPRT
ncbi:MAG: hydroxyacid dehydrogenase [Archangium gephyra]|uniref:Hydroxyacid dehydrogenase n=1 Tax=Archangium gephyra TaxID=48 RepID=A0A2W5SSM5_9BACT|nr:MAG: hydroxyacid dehydrogenase [Archangium gephyra]